MRPPPPSELPEERAPAWFLITPSLAILGVFFLYPLIQTLIYSAFELDPQNGLHWDQFVGTRNYQELFASSAFWRTLAFTLYFTGFAVALEIIGGLAIGLWTHRVGGWLQGPTRAIIFLPWAIPPMIQAAIWKWMLNSDVGWIPQALRSIGLPEKADTLLVDPILAMHCVIVAHAWRGVWFVAILVVGAMAMAPKSIFEAAASDGANPLQTLRTIAIPILKPILLVAGLLRAIDGLRAFEIVYAITGGGPGNATEVLSSHAYKFYFSYLDYGMGASYAIVALALALLVSSVYVWALMRSLDHGPLENR